MERCIRSELLTQCALKIWHKPQSLGISRQHARETLALSSDSSDFTYKQIIECSFEDEVIVAKNNQSWKDFFVDIMKVLDTSYHHELLQIASDPSLTKLLQGIFQALYIDLDSVLFQVRSKKTTSDEE